ncbi:MAG: MucB/RseB C-terminal domain-containing protein [Wenzhouxiangella sp.]
MALTRPGVLKSWLACLCLLPLAAVAAGDEDAREVKYWLDRMERAVESLDYRGSLVHWRGGQVDTFRIIHRANGDGVRERIYSLDGKPREILRKGERVQSLTAGDQPLVVQSQLAARLMPNLPVSRLGTPESGYEMRMGGEDRVAGKATRIVEIRPLDQFRYGYRFWLEQDSGMLLRSALLNQRGRVLQQLSFVDIELGAQINDADLEPGLTMPEGISRARLDPPVSSQSRSALPEPSWLPPRLPPGFELARVGRGSFENGDDFEHLVFSDGVASFSVYIESSESDGSGSRLDAMGSFHVFTGRVDGRLITVVGEVPRATVEYVGRPASRRPGTRARQ